MRRYLASSLVPMLFAAVSCKTPETASESAVKNHGVGYEDFWSCGDSKNPQSRVKATLPKTGKTGLVEWIIAKDGNAGVVEKPVAEFPGAAITRDSFEYHFADKIDLRLATIKDRNATFAGAKISNIKSWVLDVMMEAEERGTLHLKFRDNTERAVTLKCVRFDSHK